MIIELKLILTTNKILLGAWEFPTTIWEQKSKSAIDFIDTVLESHGSEYELSELNNNKIYTLKDKPHKFYLIQQALNEYFKAIKGVVIVS